MAAESGHDTARKDPSPPFARLASLASTVRGEVKDIQPDPAYRFVVRRFNKVRDFYQKLATALLKHCNDPPNVPAKLSDRNRREVFQVIQAVLRQIDRIAYAHIPIDLYFLVEQAENDLAETGQEPPLVILAEDTVFSVTPMAEKHADANFADGVLDLLASSPVVIVSMPRSGFEDPLTWPIIVHEMACGLGGLDQATSRIPAGLRTAMRSEKVSKYLVDLASLHYLGPPYARALHQTLDQWQRAGDGNHPRGNKRLRFLRSYLQAIEARIIGDAAAETFIRAAASAALQELQNTIDGDNDPPDVEDFETELTRLGDGIIDLADELLAPCHTEAWHERICASGDSAVLARWNPRKSIERHVKELVHDRGYVPVVHPVVALNYAFLATRTFKKPHAAIRRELLSSQRRYTIASAWP